MPFDISQLAILAGCKPPLLYRISDDIKESTIDIAMTLFRARRAVDYESLGVIFECSTSSAYRKSEGVAQKISERRELPPQYRFNFCLKEMPRVTCLLDGMPTYIRGDASDYDAKHGAKTRNYQVLTSLDGAPIAWKPNKGPMHDSVAVDSWVPFPHRRAELWLADTAYESNCHCMTSYVGSLDDEQNLLDQTIRKYRARVEHTFAHLKNMYRIAECSDDVSDEVRDRWFSLACVMMQYKIRYGEMKGERVTPDRDAKRVWETLEECDCTCTKNVRPDIDAMGKTYREELKAIYIEDPSMVPTSVLRSAKASKAAKALGDKPIRTKKELRESRKASGKERAAAAAQAKTDRAVEAERLREQAGTQDEWKMPPCHTSHIGMECPLKVPRSTWKHGLLHRGACKNFRHVGIEPTTNTTIASKNSRLASDSHPATSVRIRRRPLFPKKRRRHRFVTLLIR